MAALASEHPRDVLARLADLDVRELEWTSFAGDPVYMATLAGGDTRVIPLHGEARAEFDRQRIVDVVTKAAQPNGLSDIRVIDQYDAYYLDRRRERPLPVILARVNDPDQSRYYIDPKTARIVGTYSARNWVTRWAYHGLHSFDFPWLYNYRPAWDIVVITFMLGGTALCVTSLVLAWGVVGRTLIRTEPMKASAAVVVGALVLAGTARAQQPQVAVPTQAETLAKFPGSIAHQTASFKRESITIKLAPKEGMEYKYRLEKGAGLLYSWASTSPVHYELHSVPDGSPQGYAEFFDTQDRLRADGVYNAPFPGIHGWWFENQTDREMTITLTTAGFYRESQEFRRGEPVKIKRFD